MVYDQEGVGTKRDIAEDWDIKTGRQELCIAIIIMCKKLKENNIQVIGDLSKNMEKYKKRRT